MIATLLALAATLSTANAEDLTLSLPPGHAVRELTNGTVEVYNPDPTSNTQLHGRPAVDFESCGLTLGKEHLSARHSRKLAELAPECMTAKAQAEATVLDAETRKQEVVGLQVLAHRALTEDAELFGNRGTIAVGDRTAVVGALTNNQAGLNGGLAFGGGIQPGYMPYQNGVAGLHALMASRNVLPPANMLTTPPPGTTVTTTTQVGPATAVPETKTATVEVKETPEARAARLEVERAKLRGEQPVQPPAPATAAVTPKPSGTGEATPPAPSGTSLTNEQLKQLQAAEAQSSSERLHQATEHAKRGGKK